jgi:ribosomal-protein-alanine N-acetyltransferase
MEPLDMARLHAAAFVTPRPWTGHEFADLLSRPEVFAETAPQGFALGQSLGPEAELLTLAVAPEARRQGIARLLMDRFHGQAAARGAAETLLEVAADNAPARALYAVCGYRLAGRRKGYYRHPDGTRCDALILRRSLDAP